MDISSTNRDTENKVDQMAVSHLIIHLFCYSIYHLLLVGTNLLAVYFTFLIRLFIYFSFFDTSFIFLFSLVSILKWLLNTPTATDTFTGILLLPFILSTASTLLLYCSTILFNFVNLFEVVHLTIYKYTE